ncbi:MAG: LON peptidase substrate-binding domain-containing protein [Actinomycetes bacterium]
MPEDSYELAMFPLSTVAFPGEPVPLQVFEPRYRAMIAHVLEGSCRFGITLITRGHEVGGGDERADVGTLMEVVGAKPEDDGRWFIIVEGIERIAVERWLPDAPYPKAIVRSLPDAGEQIDAATLERAHATVRHLQALQAECVVGPAPVITFECSEDPVQALWSLCARAPLPPQLRQSLLSESTPRQRVLLLEEACALTSEKLLSSMS